MKNLRKMIGNIYKKANCNYFHLKNSRMNPLRGEKHNKYHEMNSDEKPELRNVAFWSNKSDSLKKCPTPPLLPCCDCVPPPPEGADVAAVGRGRAAEPAARLQQRGGGEGAVPHARGQSTGRV